MTIHVMNCFALNNFNVLLNVFAKCIKSLLFFCQKAAVVSHDTRKSVSMRHSMMLCWWKQCRSMHVCVCLLASVSQRLVWLCINMKRCSGAFTCLARNDYYWKFSYEFKGSIFVRQTNYDKVVTTFIDIQKGRLNCYRYFNTLYYVRYLHLC